MTVERALFKVKKAVPEKRPVEYAKYKNGQYVFRMLLPNDEDGSNTLDQFFIVYNSGNVTIFPFMLDPQWLQKTKWNKI